MTAHAQLRPYAVLPLERIPRQPPVQVASVFTEDLVIGEVRQSLALLGVRGHYSGHSFRRGAATSTRDADLSDEEIMLWGRWKSEAYRLYIYTSTECVLAALRRHQQRPSRQR